MTFNEICLEYFDSKKTKTFVITLITIYIIIKEKEIILWSKTISIIIPTYNRAHLILKSIKSVLNQTYQDIEILVIDDGSTDNTENLITDLNDKRIKYIKLENNQGGSKARNIGIMKASGKYISFQDSDDYYHYNKLETQFKNLKEKNSDFDFCKICLFINETNKKIFPTLKQEKNIIKYNTSYELCKGNFISSQSILVKKKYIKKYLIYFKIINNNYLND